MFATALLLAGTLAASGPGIRVTFEGGTLDSGWQLGGWGYEEGYRADVTSATPHSGHYSLELRFEGEGEPAGSGKLFFVADAAAYKNKRVTFRAALRVLDGDSSARLLLFGETKSGDRRLVAGHVAQPVRSSEWRVFEVRGDVGSHVAKLELAVSHRGRGRVLVDDIELEVTGDIPEAKGLPPAKLEDRDVLNLSILAKLVGYLRYYHPSDQAVAADWDSLTRSAVAAIDGIDGSLELSSVLQAHFAGVAPTLRLFAKKHRPDKASDWLDEPDESDGERFVVRWVHRGVGTGEESDLFSSERERLLFEGRVPRGFARPHKPGDFDLGGAAMARIPTTLYADEAGTLPHADSGEDARAVEAAAILSSDDRATRIAAVLLAWGALQHFAPLLEGVAGDDWETALDAAIRQAAAEEDEEGLLEALRHLVVQLYDGQASVYHRSDWKETHIPISWDWIGEQLVITSIADDERSQIGLGPGDVVLRIGKSSAEEAFVEASQSFSGSTTQRIRHRALEAMLRRRRMEPVKMKINAANGRKFDIGYEDPFSRARLLEARPEPYAEVAPGIRYVDLSRVRETRLGEMLAEIEGAAGIVFDVRGGIHDLSRGALIAHLIGESVDDATERVPVSTRPDREKLDWEELEGEIQPAEPRIEAKLAFLADGGVVGEAEALLALVRAHGLGQIVGMPTGGTIGSVNSVRLPGEYRLEWTATDMELPKGERLNGVGVEPTVLVERTLAGARAGTDEVLVRAVAVLRE